MRVVARQVVAVQRAEVYCLCVMNEGVKLSWLKKRFDACSPEAISLMLFDEVLS